MIPFRLDGIAGQAAEEQGPAAGAGAGPGDCRGSEVSDGAG